MADIVEIQSMDTSSLDPGKLCSFNLEVIDSATAPLIHQSARFLFINGGKGTIRIQNVEYALRPGTIVAILPWQITDVVEVLEPLQYGIVVYRFDAVNQMIKSFFNADSRSVELIQEISGSPVVHCSDAEYEKIRAVLFSIQDEVGIESIMTQTESKPMSGIYLTSLLVELIVLYLRTDQQKDNGFGVRKHHADPSQILQYMYNHLSEKLTLEMLSKLFYISESAISKYITQVTGLSFFDLLNEMRLGKMAGFLLYTDLTLRELAEILGYADASHMSKVFSAKTGIRASEYRKTYQQVGDICKVKESKKSYAIIDFIYRNYSEPLTPKSVAAQFGISVQELDRTLLYQVEKNFDDFLNSIRINHASELLLKTDKRILDIAMEVGYNSIKSFTRNFLRLRVITPSDFRKTVQLQPSLETKS